MSSAEKRYTISVRDSQINELRARLQLTRLPDELESVGWEYGVPKADLQRLIEHWRSEYDWRKHEKQINDSLPQYTADISIDRFGVLNIHYVHQRSLTANAVPLLFIHGWPGNFLEVSKILPILSAPSAHHPSFHVVALSLPGYGFSEAPKKPGFNEVKYAETCDKLMQYLGYHDYVTQGGDWGSHISRALAHNSKMVKAAHLNYPKGVKPRFTRNPIWYLRHALTPYTEAEKAGMARSNWFEAVGRGYNAVQTTQPQTLGYSLADSPAGLLAWIYEKLRNWTDDYRWTDDEILTWVSIYWFSRAGPAASLRIYKEFNRESLLKPASTPMGFSHFPRELAVLPRSWSHTTGNVIFEATHTSGGHFAAYEKPELLAGDLRRMFGRGGPAFGIVQGRNGYEDDWKTKAKL